MRPDGGDILFTVNDICKFVHQSVTDKTDIHLYF